MVIIIKQHLCNIGRLSLVYFMIVFEYAHETKCKKKFYNVLINNCTGLLRDDLAE